MMSIIPSLTEDEAAVLMIMKEGQPLVDLGEHSKWHGSLLSLAGRGLCSAVSQFKSGSEYAITEAGRTAAEEWENQSIRDVIQANNAVASNRRDYVTPDEISKLRVYGLSPKQIAALANFYTNTTGRNASEICEP